MTRQIALVKPTIDFRKLREAEEIRQKMKRAGAVRIGGYRLSPALSTEVTSKDFLVHMRGETNYGFTVLLTPPQRS